MFTREFEVSANNVKWSNSNYLIQSTSLDVMSAHHMDTTNQGCGEPKVATMALPQPDGFAVRCRDLPEKSEAGTFQSDWWLMKNCQASEECSSTLLMGLDYPRSPVGAFENFSKSTTGRGILVDEQQGFEQASAVSTAPGPQHELAFWHHYPRGILHQREPFQPHMENPQKNEVMEEWSSPPPQVVDYPTLDYAAIASLAEREWQSRLERLQENELLPSYCSYLEESDVLACAQTSQQELHQLKSTSVSSAYIAGLEFDMHLAAKVSVLKNPVFALQCEDVLHVASHLQNLAIQGDENRGMQQENVVKDAEFTAQVETVVENDELDVREENLLEDSDEKFDILKEMDLIMRRMIGERYSIHPSLEESLNYIVGIHQSLQAGVPQHCRMECLPVNDPAQCCWNAKFSEAQSSLKKAFQREITVCVNAYLRGYKKKIFMFPLHCTGVLSAWTEANYNKPYMPRNMVQNMANEWGLTVTQINHWLENWRSRQWNPIPDGQSGRKGTKFPHMKEDSTKITNWLLKQQRHPNQEEAELLSFGTRMTPKQVLVYCGNFKKRNKSRFKNWRHNRARRSAARIKAEKAQPRNPVVILAS